MEKKVFVRGIDALSPALGRKMTNLRLRQGLDGSAELIAAPYPLTLGGCAGFRPLCRLGGRLAVYSGRTVAFADESLPDAVPQAAATLPSEPLCVLEQGSDRAIVMCREGASTVSATAGGLEVREEATTYPAVSLRAVQTGSHTVSVGGRTLGGEYNGTTALSKSDAAAVKGDLVDAYCRLVASTANAGCFIQPVLARYRLLGEQGNVLFESPAVLLAMDEVTQLGGTVAVPCIDGRTLAGYEITAKAWRIEATFEADTSAGGVAGVEVLVSPQFHPFVAGGSAVAAIGRNAMGLELRVGLPGANWALAGFNGKTVLMKAIARMDALERRVAHLSRPFGVESSSTVLSCTPESDPGAETASLRKALSAKVARRNIAEVLLAPPHRFTASVVANDGIAVAWGGLRAHRAGGYNPAVQAVGRGSGSWSASVVVHFGGGKGVRSYFEGGTGAITSLNAVLSYPSPDATGMSIVVESEGRVRRFDCSLTPDESGCRAVYISPDFRPINLPSAPFASVVDIADATVDFADAIAFCRPVEPLVPFSVWFSGGAELRSLAAVRPTSQSWDFGRGRFVAGTSAGVYSISVSGRAVSGRRVDERPVARADAMLEAGDSVYALVDSSEGGTLPVEYNAAGRCRAIGIAGSYVALGYDRGRGELWALATGGTRVFCRGMVCERTGVDIRGFASVDGRSMAYGPSGIVLIDTDAVVEAVECRYCDVVELEGGRLCSPRELYADICSEYGNGALSVEAVNTAGDSSRLIAGRRFRGVVRSGIGLPMAAGACRRVKINVQGQFAAGTVLKSFVLC